MREEKRREKLFVNRRSNIDLDSNSFSRLQIRNEEKRGQTERREKIFVLKSDIFPCSYFSFNSIVEGERERRRTQKKKKKERKS